MDSDTIARELLRALRGRRSQPAFSKRLGYKSNVVYRWESGRAWPTAAGTLRAAERVGVDLRAGLKRFYRAEPAWVTKTAIASPEGVSQLLRDLRGTAPVVTLARRSGKNRFAVARWLKGETEPRLPEFLDLVGAASLRLLDFLSVLVDPAQLPSVARAWTELQFARESAYTMPWSHAVLRVLELGEYRALRCHVPGWIASRLGISDEEEQRCLELLATTRQIRRSRRRWVVDEGRTVDTRMDPKRSSEVKAWWTRVALDRMAEGQEHDASYNLFSVSRADLARIREMHQDFFQRIRSVIAESAPNECVVLFSTQLLELRGRGRAPPQRPASPPFR
jgi:hypothetical protein